MQTDKIRITDFEAGRREALEETDRFSTYMGYDHKTALRVVLLAEEALGLAGAIAEKFKADFWLEGKKDGTCRIHLQIQTVMDIEKKRELIDVSKNKKNAAYPGLMGKIRELIEDSIYFGADEGVPMNPMAEMPGYAMLGMTDMSVAPGSPVLMDNYIWTLGDYRKDVQKSMDEGGEAEEAWDELEKSIIANLADDVRVAVKGNTAEIVIEKKFR